MGLARVARPTFPDEQYAHDFNVGVHISPEEYDITLK
jgi:hypothetical protein